MSFTKKHLKITIKLNEDSFEVTGDKVLDTLDFDGLATKVALNFGNGALSPHGRISIANLSMEKINKLIRIKWNTESALLNTVKVEVKEGVGEYQTIYFGGINYAMLDLESAPDAWIHIETTMGQREILQIDKPISFPAGEKVERVLEDLVKGTGYSFENNGVNITANDMYYGGSRMDKINAICRDYEITPYFQGNVFSFAPNGKPRKTKEVVLTPNNGLIGYPKPNMMGADFTCLYSNKIYFGGMVEIKDSIVDIANRKYIIYGMRINLEANIPNGQWVIDLYGGGDGILLR